jgi:hypothetical protein
VDGTRYDGLRIQTISTDAYNPSDINSLKGKGHAGKKLMHAGDNIFTWR